MNSQCTQYIFIRMFCSRITATKIKIKQKITMDLIYSDHRFDFDSILKFSKVLKYTENILVLFWQMSLKGH